MALPGSAMPESLDPYLGDLAAGHGTAESDKLVVKVNPQTHVPVGCILP
jgi:hypothetical protein